MIVTTIATPPAIVIIFRPRGPTVVSASSSPSIVISVRTLPRSTASTRIFVVCASTTIGVILLRRFFGRQELGGNRTGALASAGLLVFLWLVYVFLSILDAYGYSFTCKYA